ncbi:NUDIX domain-containing protein [Clostridium sp. JN-1]|jgi:isopentenyldiphosphate isomerase|uniref:NUDIX hydrolase n=1 Tax=Clostridium sp. JN-1 TaxID=2483110 RepID=UPI000F0B30D7|nr:NUDIX domain-containing protein [Clostridium sp. JN-1]
MELWDIYDCNACKTGLVKKRSDILNKGEYHLASEVWIINSKREILIQQRSSNKKTLPNIWALTTGCMISGEDTLDGSIREVKEELGIFLKRNDLNFMQRIFRTNTIWNIYFVYKDIDLSKIVLQTEEVSKVKLVSIKEFKDMLSLGKLYEYPEIYYILSLIK